MNQLTLSRTIRNSMVMVLAVAAFASLCSAKQPASNASNKGGTWAESVPLPQAVSYPAVTSTKDGRVWVFGGFDADGNALKNVWMLRPHSQVWVAAPPMPTARGAAQAVATEDRIYVIGGTPTDVGQFSIVEVLDPNSGRWSSAPSMPTARYLMAAVLDEQGRIYVFGGISDNANFTFTDRLEVFDTRQQHWASAAPLPIPRAVLGGALGLHGEVYAIGGDDQQFNIQSRVDVYDPDTNTWRPAPPLPHAVENLAAVSIEGRIYAIGGLDSFVTTNKTGAVQMFDVRLGRWSLLTPMPTPRCSMGAAVNGEGKIYVIGGFGQHAPTQPPPVFAVVEVFSTPPRE